MQNREEVIKAFFSDEEKVQAIAKDEEFLNKVSGGEATPETYKEEFKKFGLDLTDEEAAQTEEMVNKIHSTPDEKLPKVLNDLSLESVSGGSDQNNSLAIEQKINEPFQLINTSSPDFLPIAIGYVAGGVACAGITVLMTGAICNAIGKRKAFHGVQAQKRGDIEEAAKYYSEAKKLAWMAPAYKSKYDSYLNGISNYNNKN